MRLFFSAGEPSGDLHGSRPSVRLTNVQLQLGTFFSKIVAPILKEIKEVLAPIKPLIDFLDPSKIGSIGCRWLVLRRVKTQSCSRRRSRATGREWSRWPPETRSIGSGHFRTWKPFFSAEPSSTMTMCG